jgi:HAD superfamily 5'-nucleotidase-like hydrolase
MSRDESSPPAAQGGQPARLEPAPEAVSGLPSDRAGAHLELLERLGRAVPKALDIHGARRVYVNRNLRMDEIDVIGFDMDYTLALYHQANLEALSIRCTLDKLVTRGYPSEVHSLPYDTRFALRGIVVDRQLGNLFKMDRYGHVGRVYHGRRPLDRDERHRLYRTERIRLSQPRYAWIDTLFALPEAVMYATLVEYCDAHPEAGWNRGYDRLWQDIRECIDEAHRDETMKRIIRARLDEYIVRDPELAPTLHKFRSAGKRLFLLTNSALDYTDPVMSFLLDGALAAYPSWRSYFDIIVVSGAKPSFFVEQHPFGEHEGGARRPMAEGPFVRGRIYEGGNVVDFERLAGFGGDRVLYIGDHIYGDMMRAKKSSIWRTAMIIQELEEELHALEVHQARFQRLELLERQVQRLDSEVAYQQQLLKSLQRLEDEVAEGHAPPAVVETARQEAKRRLDDLRAALKSSTHDMQALDEELERAFNPFWGQIFREGTENSRFGEQVEDYACVYTSRVSNFLAYSPLRYFRSPRDHMPHELV